MKRFLFAVVVLTVVTTGCSTMKLETPTIKASYTRIGNQEVDGFDAYVDNEGVPHVSFNSSKSKRDKEAYEAAGNVVKNAFEGMVAGAVK